MAIPFILLENKLKVELVPTNVLYEIDMIPNKKSHGTNFMALNTDFQYVLFCNLITSKSENKLSLHINIM
jgi:hypothetical protein